MTLFVGSHNLTRASQANHECVMQLGTVPSDANVAAYREWFTRLWDISCPIAIDHAPKPDRRLQVRAKTPAAGSSVPALTALRQPRIACFYAPRCRAFADFK